MKCEVELMDIYDIVEKMAREQEIHSALSEGRIKTVEHATEAAKRDESLSFQVVGDEIIFTMETLFGPSTWRVKREESPF